MQMRGRDFRQLAAAFLYNLTGDEAWEKIFAEESMIKDGNSLLFNKGKQGFFGIGVKSGETYRFTVWARVPDGGASTLVREKLARKASVLKGKKLLIWEFVERDLRFGAEGWKDVDF